MAEHKQVVDGRGRIWTVSRIQWHEAEEEDFRFWYDRLSSEERVDAVAFHARPRATKDLDILLEPTAANARRVLAALREFFGGADLGYTVEDLIDPQWIVQRGSGKTPGSC